MTSRRSTKPELHDVDKPSDFAVGYDLGGVSTCSKRDPEHGKRPTGGKEPHCLYPGDLYPFTRKPLFVVVDSDNSFVFQQIPRYFGQPLMVLMSPQDTPSTLRDVRHGGSLFTLFLHAPLAAFCLICNIGSLAVHHWERCQRYIERFLIEACQLVTRSRCGKDPGRCFCRLTRPGRALLWLLSLSIYLCPSFSSNWMGNGEWGISVKLSWLWSGCVRSVDWVMRMLLLEIY